MLSALQGTVPLKQVAYHILCIWLWLRTAVRDGLSWAGEELRRRFPGLVAKLRGWTPAKGSTPRQPSVLGLVITDYDPDPEMQHLPAIARIITWAHLQGMRMVLLYEPSGILKDQRRVLERLPQLASLPGGGPTFQSGWLAAADTSGDAAPAASRGPALPHTSVVLLSAEDGEWPMDAAASGTPPSPHGPAPSRSALDEALAAPARLKQWLGAVAGGVAATDPDLLVTFGPALTMAGFPAWATRAAEVYYGGPLCQASGSKLQTILRRHARTRQRHGR